MNADAVAALREALHDRHLDSEANGCDHHADEYGESLQCRDEAEALLAHPSFAALAAAPLPSEPVGRWEAVKQAPLLSDLRDAICFVERHDHLATSSYCQAGRAQAYRIREALIARYQFAAPSDTPADGLDVEELTDIIEQAIFETDTGLAAAMLAAGRIAALTQEPRSTREEDE